MFGLFGRKESLVAIDVGSSAIKLVELDLSESPPKLLNIGVSPVEEEIFDGNLLVKPEIVSEQIMALLEANSISGKRICISLPGPSVFVKKIQMPMMSDSELQEAIHFEAANYVPHDIDQVHLDFHVLGAVGNDHIDILLVAIKNEILESFVECFSSVGLEVAIADVDYFAVQNIYEISAGQNFDKTIALVNIGARYTAVSICKGGASLFVGDVGLGGSGVTTDLAEALSCSYEEADALKVAHDPNDPRASIINEILDKNTEHFATELNRQISFFWNATGVDDGIDKIILTGGGAQLPGLVEELSTKTGIECVVLNPLQGIECGSVFEADYLKEVSPRMSVALGLALREPGDRQDEWEDSLSESNA